MVFGATGSEGKRAKRLVESGRLRAAARIIGGESKLADSNDAAVVQSLRLKHPSGSPNPFGLAAGPLPGKSATLDEVKAALDSFASDTAPGVSGWTVPLLKLTVQSSPKFANCLTSIVASIGAGTCPGQSMLCASRLVPLAKKDGGVRPIAVGEMFYRLAAKTILKLNFRPDHLLPCQLGVGSKGGVEPIVRLINRAIDNDLDRSFSTLVSLDFSNAFNEVDRRDIAASVREYAPGLFRALKWAYGTTTDLLLGEHIIRSAQGARQGDPFGPFIFSIAIRPLIAKLSATLGESAQIVSYLDDMYVLSTKPGALNEIYSFFDSEATSLRLNRSKCREYSLDEVKTSGIAVLGTFVGPTDGRRSFLSAKIDKTIEKLASLTASPLPYQHRLLLLRQCFQQDLRHLQRSLKTAELTDEWKRLDGAIQGLASSLRGRVTDMDRERREMLDRELMTLPARLGGLGLLSHEECSPHAYASANEDADFELGRILGTSDLLVDGRRRVAQRERCSEAWSKRADELFKGLDDAEMKLFVENASSLGRKWLSILPYYRSLALSDFEISTALHYRTLAGSPLRMCAWCGRENALGHDELCLKRPRLTSSRHDSVVRAIGGALSTLPFVDVSCEPHTFEARRRNDIRVNGSGAAGIRDVDYDVKVYSLLGENRRAAVVSATQASITETVSLRDLVSSRLIDDLASIERLAETNRPLAPGGFQALAFSTGGLMGKATAEELGRVGKTMGRVVNERMMGNVSLALLKARARTFDMGRARMTDFGDFE